MTALCGLTLDRALEAAKASGDEYRVTMLQPLKGERDRGTLRVVAVRGRELLVARFLDMYARAETDA